MLQVTGQGGILGAAASVVLAAAPAAAAPFDLSFGWQRIADGAVSAGVAALALDPASGSLALGDARGVHLVDRAGAERSVLRRGPVTDLAFLPPALAGEAPLLAATEAGLFRIAADGRTDLVDVSPGAEAASLHRISVAAAAVAVASDAGAFLSADGWHWQALSRALPSGAVSSVSLRERAGELECLAVVEGRLWQLRLRGDAAGFAVHSASRETIPEATADDGPVDVGFGVAGADAVVVFPSSFALRNSDTDAWQVVTPALPPGARARRLVAAAGYLWLATDRGLLYADALAGPWRRAPAPAGAADVRALASDGASLYVAAGDALLAALPAGRRPAAAHLRTPEGDPPIELVQRAALRYLSLEPGHAAALRSGAARRGYLPLVTLRLARTESLDSTHDEDDAFTSGNRLLLHDSQRDRGRDVEASLSLSWDLGDTIYHSEEIDASREARELIKLRDDVLDEVTQLYFDRRRVLAELAAREGAPEEEQLPLRLRAAELAAGLDAWTGGWFGRARGGATGP